jgi:hypothetical protein
MNACGARKRFSSEDRRPRTPMDESFLLLFFKKEALA